MEGKAPSWRRTGTPCEGQRQRSGKLPLFDPVFPLFEHGRPDHGLTARRADRAVLIELRRFVAGIHAIWETPDKREVGDSSLPRPLDFRESGGRIPAKTRQERPLRRSSEGLPEVIRLGPLVALEHRPGPPLLGLRSHRHGVQGLQLRGSV